MSIRVDWFVGLLSVCTIELYSCFLERSDFLIDDWMIVQHGYIHIYFLHYKMLNVYLKGRNLKKGWEFYRLIICIKILWLFLIIYDSFLYLDWRFYNGIVVNFSRKSLKKTICDWIKIFSFINSHHNEPNRCSDRLNSTIAIRK